MLTPLLEDKFHAVITADVDPNKILNVFMNEIIRNRTIRPSTRKKSSTNYKVNTEFVNVGDTLVVNINHESKPFFESYKFNGADIASRNSIHFKVIENEESINIVWPSVIPID